MWARDYDTCMLHVSNVFLAIRKYEKFATKKKKYSHVVKHIGYMIRSRQNDTNDLLILIFKSERKIKEGNDE